MFKLKVTLLLIANCLMAANCWDTDKIPTQEVGKELPPLEAEVKINWCPVWNDNEGINEFASRNTKSNSEEDNQQNCTAPNGLGLEYLFQEVDKLMPKQQIKDIAKSYANDSEIIALKDFILNAQTREKVRAIRNSQEYQILKDYACRILHIDLAKYNQLAKATINPVLRRNRAGVGIRGFIDDVKEILPLQEIQELYENNMATDVELVKAVAHMKSDEFHQLLLNVKNNVPEYKVLRKQLIDLGVPIEEMREVFSNVFGWTAELALLA